MIAARQRYSLKLLQSAQGSDSLGCAALSEHRSFGGQRPPQKCASLQNAEVNISAQAPAAAIVLRRAASNRQDDTYCCGCGLILIVPRKEVSSSVAVPWLCIPKSAVP